MPKVDGFFSLTPREFDELLSLIYSATNADWPRPRRFHGRFANHRAGGNCCTGRPREHFLPLVTAGQKPVFLDDANALGGAGAEMILTEAKSFFCRRRKNRSSPFPTKRPPTILDSKFGNNTVDVEVEAAAPSLVVVSQTYYHNWRAEIDGQPARLLRANVAFQAVQVPAGTHRIHLFYRDRAFEAGAAISAVDWLAAMALLLIRRRES